MENTNINCRWVYQICFREEVCRFFVRDFLSGTTHHTKFTKMKTKTRNKKNRLSGDTNGTLPRPPTPKITNSQIKDLLG